MTFRPLSYNPQAHGVGLAHVGIGAFFRAHQADYTHRVLAASGGDWRVRAINLNSTDVVDALEQQGRRYTLLVRHPDRTEAHAVGAIAEAISHARDPDRSLAALADPAVRALTITVTEKGYGYGADGIDPAHRAVAHDLADPRRPIGVLGLLAEAIRLRADSGAPSLTVLSCDNLPHNGARLARALSDFAEAANPDALAPLADTAFPSSMVDRITPASTDETRAEAGRLAGLPGGVDRAAVQAEAFTEWVIEDVAAGPIPPWREVGATIVDDVAPAEQRKLWMLNGTHSVLAALGVIADLATINQVAPHPTFGAVARRHLAATAAVCASARTEDLGAYGEALMARFSNPAIHHATRQVASDASQKIPLRHMPPALEAVARGRSLEPYAFALAAFLTSVAPGQRGPITVDDPRTEELTAILSAAPSPSDQYAAVTALDGLVPPALAAHDAFRAATVAILRDAADAGIEAAAARSLERDRYGDGG